MAIWDRRERYSYAMIDCSDMTLTEYEGDSARTYRIEDILKRWDGVPNIEIEIRQKSLLPADER